MSSEDNHDRSHYIMTLKKYDFKGTVSLFLTRAPMIPLTILKNEFLVNVKDTDNMVKVQNSSVERRNREKRDVFRLLFIVSRLLLILSRLLFIVTSGFFLLRKK